MRFLARLCGLLLVLSVTCRTAASLELEPSVDLTDFFSISASSVCGRDTPPETFEDPQNSGQFRVCGEGGGEFAAENALDGNSSTRWQSEAGVSPVSLNFSAAESGVSLRLQGVRVVFRSGLPRRLQLDLRLAGEPQVSVTPLVFAADPSMDCAGTSNCQQYTVEELGSDGTLSVLCPVSSSEEVEEILVEFDGFLDLFQNTTSQYYSVYEASIQGWVADQHYVKSLTAISVEGETGRPVLLDPQQVQLVPVSTDEALIAGFSSRGFATFSFNDTTQETYEWEFPSIPRTTSYQVWLRFTNPGPEVPLTAMVISGELLHNARVILPSCPLPNACHASLVMPSNIMRVASFELISAETAIVVLTLTSVQLNLDVIFAVPVDFYEATAIEESDRFLEKCNFADGSLGQGTADEQFCLESAVQLSLNFYRLTQMCGCSEVGASGNDCEVYGGQCPCTDQSDGFARITGRRCDNCPFTTFLTTSGCAECGCADSSESCKVSSGQCLCPPLVTGRTCDSCMTNTFGQPSEGCSPCGCSLLGTDFCNDTTGECVCKQGVMGERCDVCEDGWFNLTSAGCEECGCDGVGSNTSSCDGVGQCSCQANVEGLKCSSCVPGSFFLASGGCTLCNCSGRSNSCQQNPNVTSEPSEVCDCPAPYEGGSCDQCQSGWFMSAETGNCQQCQCNGLANVCLDGNGTCLGCRDNSTGAGCDVCIDGYYDTDPSDLVLNCLPCPCTAITAQDHLCTPDPLGYPVCNCRQGHEGSECDSCSDGYFGSPPDFRCTSCDCNGNINPLEPGSCDMETGRCLKCINNSTGNECESCATGFFGDATIQNCQPCDCNAPGSEGSLCDSSTGQCVCLPGVNGLRCEQCLPGYWNFTAGVGCEPCTCEGSVLSDVCDVVTGECECSEGVGGRECDFCLHGYFDYSLTDGCSSCECGVGAVNGSCNSDGQCYCQSGVGGAKCDLCRPFTFNLSPSGCESCGECERSLVLDLEREEEILANITEQERLVMQLSEVDKRGLGEVERVVSQLQTELLQVGERLDLTEAALVSVNESSAATQETFSSIEQRVRDSLEVTSDLQPTAEEVGNHVQTIYNQVQRGLAQLVDSTQFAESAQPLVSGWVSTAEAISDDVTGIAQLHTAEGYSDDIVSLEDDVERANQIAEQTARVRDLSESLKYEAENLIGGFGRISDDVDILSSSVSAIDGELRRVQSSLEASATDVSSLIQDDRIIDDVIDRARAETESSEEVIAQTNITAICEAIDQLTAWVGTETPEMSGSGTESGPLTPEAGDGVASESGMGLTPDSLTNQVAHLEERVGTVGVALGVCGGVVNSAVNYSSSLQQEADMICRILSESLDSGGEAVDAILNYTSSIEAVEEALVVAMETREVLEDARRVVMGGEGAEFHREAQQLLDLSESLLRDAGDEAGRTEELVREFGSVGEVVEGAERQATVAGDLVGELSQRVAQLSGLTAKTILQTSEVSHFIETSANTTSATHSSLLTILTNLRGNTSAAVETVNETTTNFALAHAVLVSTNTTLTTARSGLDSRKVQLMMGETEREASQRELDGLSSDLAGLRQDLDAARRAAATIDVALRFHGNSSVGYKDVGLTPSDSATRISMVLNPSETTTGLLLHSSTEEEHSITLSLHNGSLTFATELDGADGVELVSTATGVLEEDTWYQLFATRENDDSQLSVSPLQGGVAYPTSLSSSPSPLSLPTNGTLYLGGSPALVARGYSGCLDRVVINNNLIPLLLPDVIEGSPLQLCGPRPPSEVARRLESGVWLQGGGSFVRVVNSLIEGAPPLSLAIEFRTFCADGLLLTMYSEDMAQRLAVEVVDGRLSLQFSRDLLTMATANTVGVVNNGEWHVAEVEVDANTAILLVDSNERVNATSAMSTATFSPSSEQLYIGGLPSSLQASIGSSEVSLAGCVRNLQLSGEPLSLNSSLPHSRASFSGCPAQVVAGARFTGEGGAVLRPATDDVQRISFQFHSTQLASLLLYIGNENSSISVSLYHTKIRVDISGTVLYSIQGGLNDDAWHQVVLELGNGGMNLTVDEEATATTPISGPHPVAESDVMVGGVTPPTSVAITERFRGCIDQLSINEISADFSQALSLEGVALYGCRPGATPITTPLPPPPPPPLPPPPSTNPNISVGLDGQEGSFLAFPVSSEELTESHLITIQFQTSSPNAMLLYAQGTIDFLALELMRGFLIYTYNLGSGRVILTSNHTYHDGLEHSVSLYRFGREGTMEIDGDRETVSGASPGVFSALNIHMELLFVGGTPLSFPPSNLIRFRTTGEEIPPSTRGCLLSLSINSVFVNLSSPDASQGAENCLEFYTNLATFHGLGYLQLLDEVSGGISFSASLEFQTTSCTGLLLYSASSSHPDHLALEIVDGLVRFIFDNGRRPTAVEFLSPSHLCDGEWHSVSVVKDEITGTLSVDGAEPIREESDVVNFVSLELGGPLFVGGVPDEQSLRSTVVSGQVQRSSFEGCIRNVYLSTSRTGPLERDLAQATGSSGVTFHTCNP